MPKPLKYSGQLVVMVTAEMESQLRADAKGRGVGVGQVVRELVDLGLAKRALHVEMGLGLIDTRGHPIETSSAMDEFVTRVGERLGLHALTRSEQLEWDSLTGVEREDDDHDDDGSTFADYVAAMPADDEPDEVDEHLATVPAQDDVVARLQRRGLY